nr:MAG TPA: NinB protein [Caudoviricetes sp.]
MSETRYTESGDILNIQGFKISGDELILKTTHTDALRFALKNDPFKPGEFEITRRRKKRSLEANAYMWALCTEIAEVVGCTKEEVYRRNIREGGEYTPLPIKAIAVEEFSRIWESHGIGWFCDVIDDSKIPGYKLVFAYHGSSVYDTKQMARLIDRVKADAESVGIIPLPPEQIAAMMKEWERQGAI